MAVQHQERLTAEPDAGSVADASVIILAFAMDRWELACAAVESVRSQKLPAREIIICVEGNPELAARFREHWPQLPGVLPSVRVEESELDDAGQEWVQYACHGSRIGAERTKGALLASGEIVVFLDDDAIAEPDWLEHLLSPYADPSVEGVGGCPLPVYGRPRPRWLPYEFDWIFGCAYEGLPKQGGPVLRMIGASMSARRAAVLAIGGLRSEAEDLYLACRLLALTPESKLIYEPRAVVHHHVHEDRLTWHYFWRRCLAAGRGKVSVMKELGDAATMSADRRFLARSLTSGVLRYMREFIRGDAGGVERAACLVAGLGLSSVAYLLGLVEWHAASLRGRDRAGQQSQQSQQTQQP